MIDTVISNGVEWESIHIDIPEEYMKHFDFIDLGAKEGKIKEYALNTFDGRQGLHIEIEEKYIKSMKESGINCIQADVTNISFPKNCVDFVISTHTIEHLMNLDSVEKMIDISINAAKDFVYLTWPWFGSDNYLKELDLILFPSSWNGHTTHVTPSDMKNILNKFGVNYILKAAPRILDSSHMAISPIGASDPEAGIDGYGNLGMYKPIYGEKPMVIFDEPVYYETMCLIPLSDSVKRHNAEEWLNKQNWETLN